MARFALEVSSARLVPERPGRHQQQKHVVLGERGSGRGRGAFTSRRWAITCSNLLAILLVAVVPNHSSCFNELLDVEAAEGPMAIRSVSLKGFGAHRSLRYNILGQFSISADSQCREALLPHCFAEISQDLPPLVFVDPYELETLAMNSGKPKPVLEGEVELERPEQDSKESTVKIWVNLHPTRRRSCDSEQADVCWDLAGIFDMPAHARYPKAFKSPETCSGYACGWIGANYINQIIPYPQASIKCSTSCISNNVDETRYGGYSHSVADPHHQQATIAIQGSSAIRPTITGDTAMHELNSPFRSNNEWQISDDAAVLLWQVPAGNLRHAALVEIATSALLGVSMVIVFMGVIRYGMWLQPAKKHD